MSVYTTLKTIIYKNMSSTPVVSKKTDLTHRISLLFLILATPYIPLFLFFKLYVSTLIVIATIIMFLTSIVLNKLKWSTISKIILIAGPSWSFFSCANILSPHSGAQLLLFTLIPLPLLLFEIHEIRLILFTSLIPISAYVALELGDYNWLPYHEFIPDHIILYIRISSIFTTFILLSVSVIRYFISNRRYEIQIETKNNELKQNNIKLLKQNKQIQSYLEELTKAYKELEKKKKLDTEFEIASQQQEKFLPTHMPSFEDYSLESYFKGARGVSGDFYDYKCFDNNTKFIIADVRGKSISAAFITVHLYSIFHMTVSEKTTPSHLLETINKTLSMGRNSYERAAAFAFNFNHSTHTITYSNAGIGTALYIHNHSIVELNHGGFMMGGDRDEHYDEHILTLAPGDIFLVASDGLEDVRDKHGNLFGKEKITDIIMAYLDSRHTYNRTTVTLKTEFEKSINEFQNNDLLPADDIVFIVIERFL